VLALATDGAFFPDGSHLVIRGYASAAVYAWPSMQRVGTFDLPDQPQGEGIAVGPDDTLYLSSEGLHAPVLATGVPARVGKAMAATSPSPPPAADERDATDETSTREVWPWVAGGLLALAALLALVLSLRPTRPADGPPSGEEQDGVAG